MANQIRKSDVVDSEFLDQQELESDGSSVYLTTGLVSTTAATKVVVISFAADGQGILLSRDHPAEPGDIVVITGSGPGFGDGAVGSLGALGTFTIDEVLTDTSFSVLEPIEDSSTGGTCAFQYRPGAERIGLNAAGLTSVTASNIQEAIQELDAVVSVSIGEADHKTLRQLIHLAEEGGPFEGFASGAFQETLPTATPFPTSVIWWTNAAKVAKIVEESITYNPDLTIAVDQWKVYGNDGVTVLATVTDTMTYSGVFEVSRVRTIV